jgi:hypothetical protein
VRPEPANGWVRYRPTAWPDPGSEWTDPVRGGLGNLAPARTDLSALPAAPAAPDSGLVWVPPVAAACVRQRDEWLEQATQHNQPCVVQVFAQQAPPGVACQIWVDPLALVLERRADTMAGFPAGATLLWPLIAGITTDLDRFARVCTTVRDSGGCSVVPIALRLAPVERRLLARGREDAYERLFHGPAPVEREYVRIAADHGLGGWFARTPSPGSPARQGRLEQVATIFGEIAELRTRMDDSPGRAAALFRAMREVERGEKDLEALWREGNLSVLPWCDGEIAAVLDDVFRHGRSQLRDELWSRYVGTP